MGGFGLAREGAARDVGDKSADGLLEQGPQVGVARDKLGRDAETQADEVVPDQHLAVAGRPGADADGGDLELAGDALRHFGRDAFEHERKGAGSLDGAGGGRAAASVFPCTLKPPRAWTDCGVRPMCAITGMSFSARRAISSRRFSPPSILTASAPASLLKRQALGA